MISINLTTLDNSTTFSTSILHLFHYKTHLILKSLTKQRKLQPLTLC